MTPIEIGMNWYQQSGIAEAVLTIPLVETSLLFFLLTFCLLFRFCKTGLVVAYLFIYRWGWGVHKTLVDDPTGQSVFSTIYIVFGVLVFTLAIVGLSHSARHEPT